MMKRFAGGLIANGDDVGVSEGGGGAGFAEEAGGASMAPAVRKEDLSCAALEAVSRLVTRPCRPHRLE
jgi:hypothetical protein